MYNQHEQVQILNLFSHPALICHGGASSGMRDGGRWGGWIHVFTEQQIHYGGSISPVASSPKIAEGRIVVDHQALRHDIETPTCDVCTSIHSSNATAGHAPVVMEGKKRGKNEKHLGVLRVSSGTATENYCTCDWYNTVIISNSLLLFTNLVHLNIH